jgi:type I restriction enzyme M protein
MKMKNEYKPKVEKMIVKPEESLLVLGESKGYITISKDKSRITYNATGKSYSFKDPEEAIRAEVYIELIERYKYTADRMDTEIPPPRREPKLPADIVVYEKTWNKCFIVVEAKEEETEKKIEEAKREGLGNATLLDAQYLLLACGSLRLAYDVYGKPPLEELEKHRIADIPVAYGKEPEFKYKKGDMQWDLKASNFSELEHKFQLCHNEIWEGGKRDPAIAFDEMSKLMFTKIFDERFTKNGGYYRFQIGTHEEQRNVVRRIKEIYAEVQGKETDVFKGEIELPDRLVFRLVEILQDLSFSQTDLDVKGRAFEKFLGMLFRGEFGQYFTRREIVEFMVDMLSPTKDDMCLDPACGSGGFILYAMDRVREKAEVDYAGDKRAINEIYWYFPIQNIFGIEINDRIARIAMMDMVIHEDGHTNIENNDSLADPKIFNPKRDIRLGKYTFLLTNPPFGAKVKDEEVLKQYELGSMQKKRKSQRTEILFIERCLDFLTPGGRMGIVLPDGILTNSSLQYVRDFIERKAKILAVISMPPTAFVPVGAGVKASLLFLQKKRFDGEDIGSYPIFMAIAEHIGYDATSRPDKNELPEILEEYKDSLKGKREFNPAFVVYKQQLEGRFDPDYYHPRRAHAVAWLKQFMLQLYELKELVEIRENKIDPQQYPDRVFNYLSLANITSNTGEIVGNYKLLGKDILSTAYVFERGDILFSRLRPYLNKVYLAQGEIAQGICSTEFVVFKPRSDINPTFLHTFLLSPLVVNQTKRMMTGNTLPRLAKKDLYRLRIPLPPREIQDESASITEEAYKERKEKLAKAKELLDSIEPYLLEQLGIRLPELKEKKRFFIMYGKISGRQLDPFYNQPKYEIFFDALSQLRNIRPLEDLLTEINYGTVPTSPYVEKGIPYLKILNLQPHKIVLDSLSYLDENTRDKIRDKFTRGGDILISQMGTVGVAAIVGKETEGYAFGSFIIRIHLNEEVNPFFITLLLNSNIGKIQLERGTTTATVRANTSIPAIKAIRLPIPPLQVQSQIAEELKHRRKEAEQLRSQADAIVEETKKKVEQLIFGEEVLA